MGIVTSPVAHAYGDGDPRLCARDDLEWVLTHQAVDPARERDAWREVLRAARAGDYAHVVRTAGRVNRAEPPEGNSWSRWAQWVDLRLSELADDPSRVVDLPREDEPWRLREGVLDPAARDVVQRALAATPVPAGDSRRDHVVVETPAPVGLAVRLDRTTGDVAQVATARLGVVLERTDRVRVLGVHAADAVEDPRTAGWRERWPSLASALGGWFSQSGLGRYEPQAAQAAMLRQESDERLERVAAEAAELLTLGDEDVRAVVVAFGCCVEPSYLRSWLGWMVWRIGYFDWK
ncbi:hypothetical protein Krad_4352 [Kineococcus radiotolerans SRS30216 = ATCC BAA-149]|uniref:DUF4253 domain-containing protein n=1 Tax=Kineococcus radiotolerans (strain ATCC BAA-149 / DSM 14245 / SRS30216) TaxID=266940 RepID=A6WG76_KINRD|nr:hypothetical protein Krad_4352 [Kineococcus radiotolerans SRS30216 = ATCC BAA-149]